MNHRLRLSAVIAEELKAQHLGEGKRAESISLLFGHAHTADDGSLTIVVADSSGIVLFAEDCYEARGHAHAQLRIDVRAAALWSAVQRGFTAVVDVHDHHFAEQAAFSAVDDQDDLNTQRYFAQTLPAFLPPERTMVAAALLLARGDWAARLVHPIAAGRPLAAMRVDLVGQADAQMNALPRALEAPAFSRQQAVVSSAQQQRMASLHAVVVGCGGTGSIMA